MTSPRPLPFPLQNPLVADGDTPNEGIPLETINIFPVDQDIRVDVVLNLSFNEWKTLANVIDVGRDIAYGIDTQYIWWLWSRVLIGLAMNCEDVADCIESEIAEGNTTLINSLTQNSIATGTGGNYNHVNGDITTVLDRNPPLSLQESIKPDFECNLDALWGGIRHGIVERLDDTARDLLEDLAAINDLPQRFQAFIDVIPVLGDIAEGIVTLATETIPDILNLYNSYSSEAALDEIACDLFSMVCADCRYPTFEELYNYYSTLGYEMDAMDAQTLAPMMQKIGTMIGTFQPASIVYHSMITFQLFTLYLQAEWNGNAGKSTISRFAAIGEDFGSDNWFDLCETCNEAYRVVKYNYVAVQGASYKTAGFSTNAGSYVAGKGWRVDKTSTTGGRLTMGQTVEANWKIRSIAFEASEPRSNWTDYAVRLRPIPLSETSATSLNMTLDTSDNLYVRCRDAIPGSPAGFQEIAISITQSPYVETFLKSLTVIYDATEAPSNAIPIVDDSACNYYE